MRKAFVSQTLAILAIFLLIGIVSSDNLFASYEASVNGGSGDESFESATIDGGGHC